MRILASLLIGLSLSSCGPIVEAGDKDSENLVDLTQTEDRNNFKVICLDGVQYWINSMYGGNGSVLAPRINRDTLLPARCPQTQRQVKSTTDNF